MRSLMRSVIALSLVAGLGGVAQGGELSAEDIKRVVREHAQEVRHCYTEYAMEQEDATGEVELSMVVASTGSVLADSIEVEAPGVRGQKFPRCVKHHARQWQFPESDSETTVQYPFLFQHTRAPGAGPNS